MEAPRLRLIDPTVTAPDANAQPPIPGLIGSGAAMRAVYERTRQVSPSKATVLLLGETGTGKEMIASAVHECSPRRNGPFIGVNCGALSENLLESGTLWPRARCVYRSD